VPGSVSHKIDGLGAPLDQIATARGWTDTDLAAYLGFSVVDLPRLLLRGPPRADRWHGDIERIATHVGCDPSKLAELLNENT
jgi:hypothetical protein